MNEPATVPATERTFMDDALHCLRTTFSPKGYTQSRLKNRLYTELATFRFVARHWRRVDAWLMTSALAVAVGVLTFNLVNGVTGPVGLFLTWAAFAAAVAAFVYKAVTFWRIGRLAGDDDSDASLEDLPIKMESYADDGTMHFSRFVSRDEKAYPLLHVGTASDAETVNLIEFDVSVSQALFDGRKMTIDRDPQGRMQRFDERDILSVAANRTTSLTQLQMKALRIRRAKAIRKGKSFFDGDKISLRSISVGPEGIECLIGRTSYYCSAVTNDLAAKSITVEGRPLDHSAHSMMPVVRIGDRFEPLPLSETAHLSNHVGSVILALSSDGIPVLCRQNPNASIAKDRAVLSGSGSIEFEDISHAHEVEEGHLDDVLRYGMARELLEETGAIPQDSFRSFDRARIRAFAPRIQIVGYYRDMRRGGQPIFLGFARMDESYSQIHARKPERVCLFNDANRETTVREIDPLKQRVETPKQLAAFLQEYCNLRRYKIKPSDQVWIYYILLTHPMTKKLVGQHFLQALNYAGSDSDGRTKASVVGAAA